MTLNRALLVAALVLFIIAALVLFGIVGSVTFPHALGLVAAGLACWVAAALA